MKKDKINDRILHELKRNGRIANAELADKVGLSPSACKQYKTLLISSSLVEINQIVA